MNIAISNNANLVSEIRQRLKENDGYCPCQIKKTPDTKCPCKNFRDMTEGECHCGLYIKTKD